MDLTTVAQAAMARMVALAAIGCALACDGAADEGAREGSARNRGGTVDATSPLAPDSGAPETGIRHPTEGGRPEADGSAALPCRPIVRSPECRSAACREHRCGEPGSVYDARGCFRASCSDGGACPPGERCEEVQYAPASCGVLPGDTVCGCGSLLAVMTERLCMPR